MNSIKVQYLPEYSSIDALRSKAQKRIPRFAFEYLDGGCNEGVNLEKNTREIREIELKPYYLNSIKPPTLKTTLFGVEYDAPFGVAPIGLQGLIWPKSPEILAKAAAEHNVPFILSTVTTASIEKISEIMDGKAWFQLYHPAEDTLRDQLLHRATSSGYKVLVLLADVPAFGFRPKDIRNGLSLPPRISLKNVAQMLTRPSWMASTLLSGVPQFKTMSPYIPKSFDIKQLGAYMNQTFNGVLNVEKVKRLRDKWKGTLVLKGITTEEDTEKLIKIGVDGIIVSNHGGRQLDAGESSVAPLMRISKSYSKKITIMMDSGVRSGPDIGRVLATGAECAFLGRAFMYGVAALGKNGGHHTMELLKAQLLQLMEQLHCEKIKNLNHHLKK